MLHALGQSIFNADQAYVDFTVEEGERIIKVLFGDRAGEVLKGHWQAVK
jgi:hypothetical protein